MFRECGNSYETLSCLVFARFCPVLRIKSYIVRRQDIDCLYEWAIQKDFMGRWMPESHELSQLFLGEFFWSPAFKFHNIPYFSHDGWTTGHRNEIPTNVLVTTDRYLQESGGFDCSVDESYRICLPSQFLADEMKLQWNGSEGYFFDQAGRLMIFDPSVRESGAIACLVDREALIKFLDQKGYDIVWTLLGEKIVLDGNPLHGRLEMSGAFHLLNHEIKGKVNYKLTHLENE